MSNFDIVQANMSLLCQLAGECWSELTSNIWAHFPSCESDVNTVLHECWGRALTIISSSNVGCMCGVCVCMYLCLFIWVHMFIACLRVLVKEEVIFGCCSSGGIFCIFALSLTYFILLFSVFECFIYTSVYHMCM